jgi:hypothetical protein
MANITTAKSMIQNTLKMSQHNKTYKYYQKLWEAGYEWLSIDGNNRIGAWIDFFTGILYLPKGFILPLWDTDNNEMIEIELEKKMNYPMILEEYGDAFTDYLKKTDIPITQINYASKPKLHVIFRNVNKGASLNSQEDRNCIDVPIAEIVRTYANKNMVWFGNQFSDESINKRAHESFIAWGYGCVQDFGNVFTSAFGEKPEFQMKETNITNHYEKDTISVETIKQTDICLKKLKEFVDQTNSGENFVSGNTQFTRALLGFTYRLRKNYTNHSWKDIWSFVWTNHQEWLKSDVSYKFNHISQKRTYNDMTSSGALYLPTIFQFLVRLEGLMVMNGMMKVRHARGSVSTHDIRMELNTKQKGICPLTGNKINGYNDTGKYHVDHIIPLSVWDVKEHGEDPNDISNLQLVEKRANLKKSDKIITQKSIEEFVDERDVVGVA